jgi:hypothetical protein
VPETHRLRINLVNPQTGRTAAKPQMLSETLEVDTWPLETEFPPIDTVLRADFGEPAAVELHGFELLPGSTSPGALLQLKLYWRAVTTLPANYNVFIHLANEKGELVAQGDGPPLGGFRPTLSWRPGEVFVDEHAIMLSPEIPPGEYRLWIGLYDVDTGQRLPATVAGEAVVDGTVVLQQVFVR